MGNTVALKLKSLRERASDAEWEARVNLAASYRLAHLYGMSDMIYTHISARVPGEPNNFLINSHGMLFNEITASSLIKVDLDGNVILKSESEYGLQKAGFVIHSALYAARPDVNCAMHTHTVAGMAVSSLKCGVLPLTQTVMRFYTRIAYHDFKGPERDLGERARLAASLGDKSIMVLRNHGLLTVGPTVQEAFNRMYGLERSCQAQLAAMACNTELNLLDQDVIDHAVHMYDPEVVRPYGLLEWAGLLRLLDQTDTSYRD